MRTFGLEVALDAHACRETILRPATAASATSGTALVHELHGQRQSLRQISKTLAAQGHLTGGGNPYTATAVQKMLRGG